MSRLLSKWPCLAALIAVTGCSGSTEPVRGITDEDKIAEYEQMIAGEEELAEPAAEIEKGR